MSASPVFSSAAMGRPFIFPTRSSGAILAQLDASSKFASAVTPASRLLVRPAPDMVSSGIRQLDALTGGFPRGALTEICGTASSGRTSILLSALARATRSGEVCALVDSSDALAPASAAAAGVEMQRLLWVRCRKAVAGSQLPVPGAMPKHNFPNSNHLELAERRGWESSLEQVLKVTDLLLQSNGFGMIVLDLSDIPAPSTRRIPLASWFRFRRAVEHTPTVLLILEQQPIVGSCSSVLIQVRGHRPEVTGKVSGVGCQVSGKRLAALSSQLSVNRLAHPELLDEFEVTAELLRSRLERKPPQAVTASFQSHASWAG